MWFLNIDIFWWSEAVNKKVDSFDLKASFIRSAYENDLAWLLGILLVLDYECYYNGELFLFF